MSSYTIDYFAFTLPALTFSRRHCLLLMPPFISSFSIDAIRFYRFRRFSTLMSLIAAFRVPDCRRFLSLSSDRRSARLTFFFFFFRA